MKDQITNHFSDGQKWGIKINYIEEDKPLGTAGSLSLLKDFEAPIIITNGDVFTNFNYRSLLDFHIKRNSDGTMVIRPQYSQIDYGVVEVDGEKLISFDEKPIQKHFINSGVYSLSSSAIKMVEKDTFLDMPKLFEKINQSNKTALCMPMFENWIDIGRHEDFDKAIGLLNAT